MSRSLSIAMTSYLGGPLLALAILFPGQSLTHPPYVLAGHAKPAGKFGTTNPGLGSDRCYLIFRQLGSSMSLPSRRCLRVGVTTVRLSIGSAAPSFRVAIADVIEVSAPEQVVGVTAGRIIARVKDELPGLQRAVDDLRGDPV